jgi:hypothetical protein
MPSAVAGYAPNLDKYLKSLKGQPLELSIENLVSFVNPDSFRSPLLTRHHVLT